MVMQLIVFQIIQVFLSFSLLFLGIGIMLKKKKHKHPNLLLGTFIMVFGYVGTHLAFHSGNTAVSQAPNPICFENPFVFLLAPVLYIYYKRIFDSSFRFTGWKWLHLMPTLIIYVVYISLFWGNKQGMQESFPLIIRLVNGVLVIQISSYLLLIGISMIKITLKVHKLHQATLKRYAYVISGLTLGIMLATLILLVPGITNFYGTLLSVFVFYFIIYQVFFNPEAFNIIAQITAETHHLVDANKKLSEEEVQLIYEKLGHYIEKSECFLDFNVDLPKIAYQVNVGAHHLLQAIKQKTGLGFSDYINKQRVEYSKAMLADIQYHGYTLEAIGHLSGFKTTKSYVNSFIKYCGMEPAQFKRIEP